eukprot:15237332-Alexandrium_andersonii.AAC.1
MEIPGRVKHDMTRGRHKTLLMPAHESLHAEIANNPDLLDRLDEAVQESTWGDNFKQHPIVVANSGKGVLPVAVYMDGLPYTKTDAVLGVYVYNLISNIRHLVAILRKAGCANAGAKAGVLTSSCSDSSIGH